MNWEHASQFGVAGAVTVALSLLSQSVFVALGDPYPGWYIAALMVNAGIFILISLIMWGRYDDEKHAIRRYKKKKLNEKELAEKALHERASR